MTTPEGLSTCSTFRVVPAFVAVFFASLPLSAGAPVVLKDAEGKFRTIAKSDVEIMQSGKVSIMPELKKLLIADEVASLVAYLQYLAAQ